MASLRYMQQDVADFDSLIEQPFDLDSPCRSTVPHLAYWSNPNERLAEFEKMLGLPIPADVTLTFEYTVSPPRGKGTASHTDLLIAASQVAVGTEAKYTEQEYPLVSVWLRKPPSDNRKLVLEVWLDLISHATGRQLSIEQVKSCTYQLIHRTASVCSVQAEKRMVVYHCFDLDDGLRRYYTSELQALARLVATPDKLRFALVTNTLCKSEYYCRLQAQWQTTKSRDYSEDVRNLLKGRNIAMFGQPVVTTFA